LVASFSLSIVLIFRWSLSSSESSISILLACSISLSSPSALSSSFLFSSLSASGHCLEHVSHDLRIKVNVYLVPVYFYSLLVAESILVLATILNFGVTSFFLATGESLLAIAFPSCHTFNF
jgi:hypothetical protein